MEKEGDGKSRWKEGEGGEHMAVVWEEEGLYFCSRVWGVCQPGERRQRRRRNSLLRSIVVVREAFVRTLLWQGLLFLWGYILTLCAVLSHRRMGFRKPATEVEHSTER